MNHDSGSYNRDQPEFYKTLIEHTPKTIPKGLDLLKNPLRLSFIIASSPKIYLRYLGRF